MLASVIAPDKTAMLVNMGFLIFRLPYHVPSSHAIGSLKAEKPFSGCLNPIPTMQTKMPKMNFTVKPFPELTTAELHAIYTARVAVFVVEQACSYQEVDAQAQTYLHDFYASFGFIAQSESYLEDNIPHMDMLLPTVQS